MRGGRREGLRHRGREGGKEERPDGHIGGMDEDKNEELIIMN